MKKKSKFIVSATISVTMLAGFSSVIFADEAALSENVIECAEENSEVSTADSAENDGITPENEMEETFNETADSEPEVNVEAVIVEEAENNEISVSLSPGAVTLGDQGDYVIEIQQLLANTGYYTETIDGDFGYYTYYAVCAFQEDNGLLVDGIVGSITLGALYDNTSSSGANSGNTSGTSSGANSVSGSISQTLSYGAYGDDVITLQTILTVLGYGVGTIDGDFGSMTEQGVMAFQADYGLTVDGIFGPISLEKMNSVYTGSAASGGSSSSGNTGSGSTTGTESEPSVSSDADISYGMEGQAVAEIQQILLDSGFMWNAVDGSFGYITQTAVEAFQLYNGLPVTGIVDSATRSKMNSGNYNEYRVLGEGFSGEDVTLLQTVLQNLGYLDCDPTGYYGTITANALATFQADNNLSNYGVFDHDTLLQLAVTKIPASDKSDENEDKDTPEDPANGNNTSSDESLGQQIVDYALQWVGVTPYVSYYDRATVDEDGTWNGNNSLTTGTDCSGFTQLIYSSFGIDLPAASLSYQSDVGTQITYEELLPGDIVVYRYGGHVAIYAGKDEYGNDMIVHCANETLGTIYGTMFYQIPTAYVRVVN